MIIARDTVLALWLIRYFMVTSLATTKNNTYTRTLYMCVCVRALHSHIHNTYVYWVSIATNDSKQTVAFKKKKSLLQLFNIIMHCVKSKK